MCGSQPEIKDGSYEVERTNIGLIVGQLRAEGQVIDDDILGLMTPLFQKHVNPFGKYHFHLERIRQARGGPEQGIA